MVIDPKSLPIPKLHSYLLSAVVPRPIALASTVDQEGHVNLSPFCYFNVFSTNPPVMIFSPSRRGRDSTTKHTYENVRAVPEVVINIVNYRIVEQVSLASCEFPRGINEFVKAGLTEVPSTLVRPPRVAESPVSFECKVREVIPMGEGPSAGNLVMCEILLMHVDDTVLDASGRVDPFKLDAVARMGADYYLRAQGQNIFIVPKPNDKLGMGFDQLPESIRRSPVLTGNDLAKLANFERIPEPDGKTDATDEVQSAVMAGITTVHKLAKLSLERGDVGKAWQILLALKR